jgi:AMMECR1 domain-containing protein
MELSKNASAWLLRLARQSIEYFLETKQFIDTEKRTIPQEIQQEVMQMAGVFVILEILRHGKKKRFLRGQNGTFEVFERLDKSVAQLAVNAAFFDSSTPRLKAYELNDLKIHLFLPAELKLSTSLDALLTAIQKNPELGIMVSAYNRMAYDLPVLRDKEEATAHRLRRLRLQIGVAKKNADIDVEYYTFEGLHITEDAFNGV